ncbi:MAG TPA: hypothetical protein PKD55_16615 [Bellilinea sp.]|nr:hypothetical protein [Bellilinea sp.]
MSRKLFVFATFLLLVTLAGCSSFASDITPPPHADVIAQNVTNSPTLQDMPPKTPTEPATATTDPAATAAPMPETIAVTGKLTGVEGAELEGISVRLYGFDGMNQAYEAETKADADGSFNFKDVPFVTGRGFMTSADINGMTLSSDVYHSLNNVPSSTIELPINIGTTSDASALHSTRAHIFLDFTNPDLVQVVQLFVLNNGGPNAIVSDGGKPIFTVEIPADAANLQFGDGSTLGEHYIKTDTGFGETLGIPPGEGSQLMFAYELPFKSRREIRIYVPVETDAAVVMVPEGLVTVKGKGLEPAGVRNVQGANVAMFNASNLAAGSTLAFEVSSQGAGGSIAGNSTGIIIGAAILALALIGAVIWFMTNRKRSMNQQDCPDKNIPESREDVMDAIIALDDCFQEGRIEEAAYKSRRAELKEKLKELNE